LQDHSVPNAAGGSQRFRSVPGDPHAGRFTVGPGEIRGDAVEIHVVDDGTGFSADAPAGIGLVAMRVGKKLSWDAQAMKCRNALEADRYLKESYRAGWEISS